MKGRDEFSFLIGVRTLFLAAIYLDFGEWVIWVRRRAVQVHRLSQVKKLSLDTRRSSGVVLGEESRTKTSLGRKVVVEKNGSGSDVSNNL